MYVYIHVYTVHVCIHACIRVGGATGKRCELEQGSTYIYYEEMPGVQLDFEEVFLTKYILIVDSDVYTMSCIYTQTYNNNYYIHACIHVCISTCFLTLISY